MLYELVVRQDGEIISRGGIKATLKTVKKWIAQNQESCPPVDGQEYGFDEANEDAITWREYLSLPWWDR